MATGEGEDSIVGLWSIVGLCESLPPSKFCWSLVLGSLVLGSCWLLSSEWILACLAANVTRRRKSSSCVI